MERTDGPRTPYEVYCYDCHVTFAAGTRRCIHCGGRMGSPPSAPGVVPQATTGEAESEPTIGRRLGGMSLWVLLALGAALSRMCGGG